MHWSGQWRLLPISTGCTGAVHSQISHLYASGFSLLSLLLIPLWSDSREGQMGTSSSCRGKWREEAGSDFMWKIKFPQWGKWNRVLSKVEESIPSCSPASVTLGNYVLSHGHFEHVMQGDSSLWASVEMSDELQWEMNSHRGERGCPAPFAKTAGSYWSVLEGDKAQPDRQDLIA